MVFSNSSHFLCTLSPFFDSSVYCAQTAIFADFCHFLYNLQYAIDFREESDILGPSSLLEEGPEHNSVNCRHDEIYKTQRKQAIRSRSHY